jgi:hypothetical protein
VSKETGKEDDLFVVFLRPLFFNKVDKLIVMLAINVASESSCKR